MKAAVARIARDVGGAFDGPTLLRDMASIGAPLRVGLSFLLLNAVLGGVQGLMIIAASSGWEPFGIASQQMGLGQFLACTLMLGIGGVLTLLIPLRAAGGFEVPRWGNYFDQVVMSGISPSRYLGGKLAAQNVFFWLVIGAALPYAIFSLSLGGTQPGYVFRALLALWLYANLLTVVSVASGAFFNEVGAGVSTILLFGLIYLLGLSPLPPYVGALVPSHALIDPFWQAMTEVGHWTETDWRFDVLMVGVRGASYEMDSFQVYVFGAVTTGLLALCAALLGPVRCIVGETAAFGEVVMEGDSKKAGVMRRHKMLQRRTEMAFFYENRGDLLLRWEAPLRYAWVLACFALPAAIYWMAMHQATIELAPDEWYLANTIGFGVLLVCGALAFTGDKSITRTRLRAGSRSASVGALNAVGFLLICVLVTLFVHQFALWREGAGAMGWDTDRHTYATDRRVGLQLHAMCPLLLAMAIQLYAMLYLLSARVWLRGSALVGAAAALGMLWFVPYGMAMTYAEYYGYNKAVMPKLVMLAELSPMPVLNLMGEARGRFQSLVFDPRYGGDPGRTVLYHWGITAVMMLWAVWYHGRMMKTDTGVAERYATPSDGEKS